MEKFFLRGVLTGNELDIVHQEKIRVPVLVTEFHHTALFQGSDQLGGELVTFGINDMEIGMLLLDDIGDGIKQMGLTQTAFSVDKQRVVGGSGLGCHSPGAAMGKLIGRSHNKVIKGKLLADGIQIVL